jgi:hypothetical protein
MLPNVAVASAIEEVPVDVEGREGEGVSLHAEEETEESGRRVGSEEAGSADG